MHRDVKWSLFIETWPKLSFYQPWWIWALLKNTALEIIYMIIFFFRWKLFSSEFNFSIVLLWSMLLLSHISLFPMLLLSHTSLFPLSLFHSTHKMMFEYRHFHKKRKRHCIVVLNFLLTFYRNSNFITLLLYSIQNKIYYKHVCYFFPWKSETPLIFLSSALN